MTLDAIAREQVYLEILMQNIAFQSLVFDRILLEAVHGLMTLPLHDDEVGDKQKDARGRLGEVGSCLLPGDTRQQLFKLYPSSSPLKPTEITTSTDDDAEAKEERSLTPTLPKSSFLPAYVPGSILPLGRLDLSWRAGPAHDRGRLQTSTLNRRIANAPAAPPAQSVPSIAHPRLSASSVSTQSTPAHGSIARIGSPRPVPPPKEEPLSWEFDLVLKGNREVEVEQEMILHLRIGMRSQLIDEEIDTPQPPELARIALQYLTRPQVPAASNAPPAGNVSATPRSSTPQSRPPTVPPALSRTSTATTVTGPAGRPSTGSRPFSPLGSPRVGQGQSQAMTPVATQLRQAMQAPNPARDSPIPSIAIGQQPSPARAAAAAFPPPPFLAVPLTPRPAPPNAAMQTGRIHHLGNSLTVIRSKEWILVEERLGTTYAEPIAPPRRWEATHEVELRFIALNEGLAELGGVRVLVLEDENGMLGSVGREWESLGDVWVVE